MIKNIYIINGSGGVGKDTFVSLVNECSCRFNGVNTDFVMNVSSVDEIKRIAKEIGWDGSKDERNRKFLSDLKLLCTEYNDLPFRNMKEKVDYFKHNSRYDTWALFLHIREPEEIKRAKEEFGAKTILIRRDNIEQITSNMADANVLNYKYDIVIDNNGTIEDLRNKAWGFIDEEYVERLLRGIS